MIDRVVISSLIYECEIPLMIIMQIQYKIQSSLVHYSPIIFNYIMSTHSLYRKKYATTHTRQLLKLAVKKHPEQIDSIKTCFQINMQKCQRFAEFARAQTQLFRTNFQGEDEDQQLVIAAPSRAQTAADRSKQYRKGLKNRRQLTIKTVKPGSSPLFFGNSSSLNNFDSRLKINNKSQLQSQNPASNTHRFQFWKKIGRGFDKPTRRLRTQKDENMRIEQNSIGDITRFCSRKNNEGVNYLISQLKINIADYKRLKNSASLPPK